MGVLVFNADLETLSHPIKTEKNRPQNEYSSKKNHHCVLHDHSFQRPCFDHHITEVKYVMLSPVKSSSLPISSSSPAFERFLHLLISNRFRLCSFPSASNQDPNPSKRRTFLNGNFIRGINSQILLINTLRSTV